MRWLREPSPAAVADALRMAAPDLAGLPVTIPSLAGQDDPVWQMSTAALGEDYIVKFACLQAAARFVLHQIRILEMLAVEPAVPYLPEVVAAGTSPLIRSPGECAGQACSRSWTGSAVIMRPGSSRGSWR